MKRLLFFVMAVLCIFAFVSCTDFPLNINIIPDEIISADPVSGGTDRGAIFAGGKGTSADPYLINTKSELTALAGAVNSGESYNGCYIKLTADISFGGSTISPIGNLICTYEPDSRVFAGYFDGGCHTVSDFTINSATDASYSAAACAGLFGYVSGTVENLSVKDFTVNVASPYTLYGGAVAGYVSGTVRDCFALGNVTVSSSSSDSYAGAVGYSAGMVERLISCVKVSATVTQNKAKAYSGGVCGFNDGKIKSCLGAATVTVSAYSAEFAYAGAVTAVNDGVLENSGFSEASFVCGTGDVYTLVMLRTGDFYTSKLGFDTSKWTLNIGYYPKMSESDISVPASCPQGSYGSPISVSTLTALKAMDPYKCYILTSDISLGSSFIPISAYYGTLFGDGHTLSSMRVSSSIIGYFGFVGLLGGRIENTVFSSATVIAGNSNGGFAGIVSGLCTGEIKECRVNGTVNNTSAYNNYSGGITGYLRGGRISLCTSDVTMDAKNVVLTIYSGGIAGRSSGYIEKSSAKVNIYARSTCQYPVIGGLVAKNEGTVENCFASGNIHAEAYGETACAGGLVGINCGGTVKNSYCAGGTYIATSHNGGAYSGGVVGDNREGKVIACFATGNVECNVLNADAAHTGFVAGGDGTATDCFYTATIKSCASASGTIITTPENAEGSQINSAQTISSNFIFSTLGWSSDIWLCDGTSMPKFK